MSGSSSPVRLPSHLVERPWGGEIWYTPEPPLSLLVKFIYTHEALSVQVHPGDDYAAKHHASRGKTELWHIVKAEPDARLALGFRQAISRERLRESALSGAIEELLNWVHPHAGDTFFTPAGTVHAIGAGLELWEIQQHSDITYRLYDYGRGRELHLDHAVNVTSCDALAGGAVTLPVHSKYFDVDRLNVDNSTEFRPDGSRYQLLICMEGAGTIAGEPFSSRETWYIGAGIPRFQIVPSQPSRFLTTASK